MQKPPIVDARQLALRAFAVCLMAEQTADRFLATHLAGIAVDLLKEAKGAADAAPVA